MRYFLLISVWIVFSALLNTQPAIQWQYSYGGTLNDDISGSNTSRDHIVTVADGGFVIGATSYSSDGDVAGHNGTNATSDWWIFKIDSLGQFEWQVSLGGTDSETLESINPTSDNGFIVAGTTYSSNGDVTGYHASATPTADCWIAKLDSFGTIEWQSAFGGFENDGALCAIEAPNGDFVFVGYTSSDDGDVYGNHGTDDIWMVRLNSSGNLLWQKCIGGSNSDVAKVVRNTADNGFIILGSSRSSDFDATGNSDPLFGAIWVIKTDASGNILWQETYGGTYFESEGDIQPTFDGGYIFGVTSLSANGDVNCNHGLADMWVVKTDSLGGILWTKCYGGSLIDEFRTLRFTPDGGYIACGSSISTNGNVTGNNGLKDAWIVKADVSGSLQWQKNLGGSGDEYAHGVQLTSDGGLVMVGDSFSNDGDVSGHHGSLNYADIWVVKLAPFLSGLSDSEIGVHAFSVSPNPSGNHTRLAFNLKKAGDIMISLYDVHGRMITVLENQYRNAGHHELLVHLGALQISGGLYFVKVSSSESMAVKKISYIK
jgi:hypothetical protein